MYKKIQKFYENLIKFRPFYGDRTKKIWYNLTKYFDNIISYDENLFCRNANIKQNSEIIYV